MKPTLNGNGNEPERLAYARHDPAHHGPGIAAMLHERGKAIRRAEVGRGNVSGAG